MILTSHYMADVVALCPRVMLIHHGCLLHDGELGSLARRMMPFKIIRITLAQESLSADALPVFPAGVEVIETDMNMLSLRVPREEAPEITEKLLQTLMVADLTVEDPAIEAVIDQVYTEGEQ